MTKIYTKKGDKGKTTLLGGHEVSKDSPWIEALGAIDELNSLLGLVLNLGTHNKYVSPYFEKLILRVQNTLLVVGSVVAGRFMNLGTRNPALPRSGAGKYMSPVKGETEYLEKKIDEWQKKLPPLKNLILPGGGRVGASLHLARAVCRRAERRVVALKGEEGFVEEAAAYLNRLSDFLFVAARFVNQKEGC